VGIGCTHHLHPVDQGARPFRRHKPAKQHAHALSIGDIEVRENAIGMTDQRATDAAHFRVTGPRHHVALSVPVVPELCCSELQERQGARRSLAGNGGIDVNEKV
jgi:hypothetical protein